MKLKKSAKPLAQLEAEHAALYREFLPTLTQYQDMAAKALELQIGIAKGRFIQAFPKARHEQAALIATFSARETPAKLAVLLDALAEKKIEVGQIVYDPRNFAFHLYGVD